MTDKAIESELDRIIREYVFGLSEEESEPEEKKEPVQEPGSTSVEKNMTFIQVLQFLEREYAHSKELDKDDNKSEYYYMAKHPLLKGMYLTLIEECEEDGWKTVIYPYIAVLDEYDNEVEDIHFLKEAWFDHNWSMHRIPLN